jgi:acyl-coenzyme A synthetase/AMP-(fatty) acid ligase
VLQGWLDRRAGECPDESVRRRLADLKVPEEIVFLEKLPKGISGKIDRAALKQLQVAA